MGSSGTSPPCCRWRGSAGRPGVRDRAGARGGRERRRAHPGHRSSDAASGPRDLRLAPEPDRHPTAAEGSGTCQRAFERQVEGLSLGVRPSFATIGGLLALFLTGQYLSVPSAIGFIAVFGVAMLNGIVLVSFLNDRRRKGFSIREAVREGAALRLRPVLMTASVAILGLIPMLLSQGVGAETQRPLATVVVGGLFTSTALTLLLLPLMYEWLETRRERRLPSDRNGMEIL